MPRPLLKNPLILTSQGHAIAFGARRRWPRSAKEYRPRLLPPTLTIGEDRACRSIASNERDRVVWQQVRNKMVEA